MDSTSTWRTVLALALAALVGAAGSAQAAPGSDKDAKSKEKTIEKRRVVMIDDDGDRRVIEGDGATVRRGYLGVELTDLTPELRAHFGVAEDAGVMVSHVEAGSPAEKAGIKVGDILTTIDGKAVENSFDLRARVRKLDDGQQVPLELSRGGKLQTVTAAIVQRDRPELDLAPLFLKRGDGDNLVLRLNRGELPDGARLALPGGEGPGMKVLHLRGREVDLEKQLKDLEKRLNELEKQLRDQKKP
jgi:membrane-associated protease RseP (regulator of RpoE activity)